MRDSVKRALRYASMHVSAVASGKALLQNRDWIGKAVKLKETFKIFHLHC
jgi:hypothetical protein